LFFVPSQTIYLFNDDIRNPIRAPTNDKMIKWKVSEEAVVASLTYSLGTVLEGDEKTHKEPGSTFEPGHRDYATVYRLS